MIDWLLQTTDAHPDLRQGIPPAGLLSPVERAKFERLKTEKRRRDWLLGRWTAKHLVQSTVRKMWGEELALSEFSVLSDRHGVPVVWFDDRPAPMLTLSISHSGNHALAAAAPFTIGADIERIAHHTDAFIEDFFTGAEISLLKKSAPEMFDTLVCATWSAKESALKLLGLGLTVDTQGVFSLIDPCDAPPKDWIPFNIFLDVRRLGVQTSTKWLRGWWRTQNNYVLTLAAPGDRPILR